MPNWVSNEVVIHGKKEIVEALGEFIGTDKEALDFAKIYAPAESVDYESGWYDWNCRNWGTKWNACEATKETGYTVLDKTGKVLESSLSLFFETAWNQPEPIFEWFVTFAKKFNLTLSISYEEEQGWGGTIEVTDGKYSSTTWDIPSSHADYVGRSREDSCFCQWSADDDDWFPDCPRVKE